MAMDGRRQRTPMVGDDTPKNFRRTIRHGALRHHAHCATPATSASSGDFAGREGQIFTGTVKPAPRPLDGSGFRRLRGRLALEKVPGETYHRRPDRAYIVELRRTERGPRPQRPPQPRRRSHQREFPRSNGDRRSSNRLSGGHADRHHKRCEVILVKCTPCDMGVGVILTLIIVL